MGDQQQGYAGFVRLERLKQGVLRRDRREADNLLNDVLETVDVVVVQKDFVGRKFLRLVFGG